MATISDLSESKRNLLERCLRGDLQIPMISHASPEQSNREVTNLSTSAGARVSVLPIQPSGSKRPFFYLHPHWYGGAGYCFTVAQVLGMDQPLYVLDPYRYDGLRIPPSIETVAEAYAEAIRAVQPQGPYLLGGFCGGGLIAFEIAQQLRAQGQAVDLLVLIESEDGPALHRMLPRRIVGGAFRKIGGLLGASKERQLDWFASVRHVYIMARYPSQRPGKSFWQSIRPFPSMDQVRQDPIGLFVWAISEYRPRRYPSKMTYFWAQKKAGRRLRSWKRVREANEIEIHVIAGSHTSCRNEDVGDMARQLKACLEAVQGTTSGQIN